jgi:hypothetical protein
MVHIKPVKLTSRKEIYDELARELNEMTDEEIIEVFDRPSVLDREGHTLTRSLPFWALLRAAKGL